MGARPVPGVTGGPRAGHPPEGAEPGGAPPSWACLLEAPEAGGEGHGWRGAQALDAPDVPAGSPSNPVGLAFISAPPPRFILGKMEVSVGFLHTGPICETFSHFQKGRSHVNTRTATSTPEALVPTAFRPREGSPVTPEPG